MAKKITDININDQINKGVSQVKEAAKNANDFVYDTSEEVVDFSIKRGAEWQNVADKAIKGGLKLAANQQDLVFDTLEVLKGQIKQSSKRFSSLFSKN